MLSGGNAAPAANPVGLLTTTLSPVPVRVSPHIPSGLLGFAVTRVSKSKRIWQRSREKGREMGKCWALLFQKLPGILTVIYPAEREGAGPKLGRSRRKLRILRRK